MSTRTKPFDLLRVKHVVINNFLDTGDLISMLEITVEDLLDKFEDRLYEHKDKFLLEEEYDQLGEEELGEETTEEVVTEEDEG